MKFASKNLNETLSFADTLVGVLIKRISTQDTPQSTSAAATVVGLQGNLGSGKTALAKSIAQVLGITNVVTSPTFVIEKIYQLEKTSTNSIFSRLIHIDAYRLENAGELIHLGWNESLSDPSNLILIEWPEHVQGCIPSTAVIVNCLFIDESTREYSTELK